MVYTRYFLSQHSCCIHLISISHQCIVSTVNDLASNLFPIVRNRDSIDYIFLISSLTQMNLIAQLKYPTAKQLLQLAGSNKPTAGVKNLYVKYTFSYHT